MKTNRKRRAVESAEYDDSQDWAPEGPAFTDDAWREDSQEILPEEEEKVYPHSIFKPRVKQPNFILCVLVNAVRILCVLVLVGGLALVGAVAGIAKGYVETAPSLDLAALDALLGLASGLHQIGEFPSSMTPTAISSPSTRASRTA